MIFLNGIRIMNEIISYKMCAVKVRNAKLRNYLKYCSCFSGYFLKLLIGIKNWTFCKLILLMSYKGQSCLKFIKVAV